MDDQPGITLKVNQNEFLAVGDDEMHAILTVAANSLAGIIGEREPGAAEVIAIDCSGSMDYPKTKIAAARHATQAAIDTLRDGAHFAVIEGTHTASMVYPAEQRLVAATPRTRSEAKQAVGKLAASGGTAMGSWLRLAYRLLDTHPTAVRHAILLTDGQNESETREELDAALAQCEGTFVCDARGIGEAWAPEELLRIVSALRGSADAVREDADLVADFTAMMQVAMGKIVPDLRLRIRTPPYAQLRYVRQVYPTENDLTESAVVIDAQTTQFSTGSWAENEDREYHVCLTVDGNGHDRGEEVLAARVDLAITPAGEEQGEPYGAPDVIRVVWTDDLKLSSVLHPKVAHYTGQAELGTAMRAGIEAYGRRDLERAAVEFGRAVALAARSGNDKALTRLRRLVDVIDDPTRGRVRIKPKLLPRDVLSVAMAAVMSARSPDVAPPLTAGPTPPAGTDRPCPRCDYVSPATAVYCSRCGKRLGEAA